MPAMRIRRLLLAAAALGTIPLSGAAAQRAVLLEIRPQAGDTLHMRLDQQVEVTGTTRVGSADSSVTAISSMRLHSRTIVQRSDSAGSTVLAITDSVELSADPPQLPPAALEQVRRALVGHQVRLRITPDGAAEILSDADELQPEMRAFIAQMPATLPQRRIAIGERWTHTMQLPGAARADLTGPVALKATFRLDSLGRSGRVAYISMRGELSRTEADAPLPGGAQQRMTGTLEGYLVVDRQRGWMIESNSVLSVRSVMVPLPGSEGEPMHLRMQITQRLRTLDKR